MVKFPTWIRQQREYLSGAWESRAIALLSIAVTSSWVVEDRYLRKLLRGAEDHGPVRLGSCFHLALWAELLGAAQSIDKHLLEDMTRGFSILGPIKRSYRWDLLQADAEVLSLQDLESRAWEFSSKVRGTWLKQRSPKIPQRSGTQHWKTFERDLA